MLYRSNISTFILYMRCCGCSTLGEVNLNLKKVTWTVLVYDTPNFVKAINKTNCPQVSCHILWTIFIQYHVFNINIICMGGIDFWNITLNNIWHNVGCNFVMISVITFFCSGFLVSSNDIPSCHTGFHFKPDLPFKFWLL